MDIFALSHEGKGGKIINLKEEKTIMENTSVFAITLIVIVMLITIVRNNNNISPDVRNGLTATFLIILVGTTCEWLYISIENGFLGGIQETKVTNTFSFVLQLINFLIVPILPIIYSKAMFEQTEPDAKSKLVFKNLRKYIVLEEIFIFICFFCSSEKQNTFYKNGLYYIYIVSLLFPVGYLFYNAYIFSKKYQVKKIQQLIEIMMLAFVGIYPDMKTGWLGISIIATFIYVYYNENIECVDGLTQLLDHRSIDNAIVKMERKKKNFILLIFDVNDFKKINDIYGHHYGDEILSLFGKILKENYCQYGTCYRVGGDEFAAIMEDNVEKVIELNSKLVERLEIERKNEKEIALKEKRKEREIPYISYGMAKYNPSGKNKDEGICETKYAYEVWEKADKNMYKFKAKSKAT